MISAIEPEYVLGERIFSRALNVVERSEVVALLAAYHAEDGVGQPRGRVGERYTLTAVLVAALARVMLSRQVTMAGIQRSIADLTPDQRARVGMAYQGFVFTRENSGDEHKRFHGWLTRQLACLDSSPHQPARRISNAESWARDRQQTDLEQHRCALAAERTRIVINRLVAASINDPKPAAYRGDVVADESIIDLAKPSQGLGSRPEKNRAGAYCGRYYTRDKENAVKAALTAPEIRKAGFGVGLSALTRVGPPDGLHRVSPVIIGIDIHDPTQGSVAGLANAIVAAKRNGLNARPQGRGRRPFLTVDMGYNPQTGFAPLMVTERFAAVVKYPANWGLALACVHPEQPADIDPGPIQFAGSLYCPAVAPHLTGHRRGVALPKTRNLLADDGWRAHDDWLRNLLPFHMGMNSRPLLARPTRGRPRIGDPIAELVIKVQTQCPAEQFRVRCPLKPNSMSQAPIGAITAEPTWSASDKQCCNQSITTITLTPTQAKRAQWSGMPAGGWDHLLYYEAARALTEQRFSILKSPHITGLTALNYGPRREPFIKLIFALAVAASNCRIEDSYDTREVRHESIDIRWKHLRKHLGYEPMRTPPLT